MKNRRSFIKKAPLALVGLSAVSHAFSMPASSYRKIIGSNDRINIAVQGLGRRGPGLLYNALSCDNIELICISDVMDKQIDRVSKGYYERTGKKVKVEKKFFKIIEDKDLDVLVVATPDHWHAYSACKAMEYGKHVYLEKPCSHNMFENEMLVKYQKYFNLKVQMGNQQRSSKQTIDLINKLRNGVIGETYKALAFYHNNRPEVPNQKVVPIPSGLDWDEFQGPAVRRTYTYDTWDYNWRWYGWLYGTGEAGNNATHELDIARWALDVDYPEKVDVYAGKYHFKNDGWTMYDTMEAKFIFNNGKLITWDGQSRNAFEKDMELGRGTKIWGSKGTVWVNRNGYQIFNLAGDKIYDSDNDDKFNNVDRYMTEYHFENFFNSIRKGEKLNSPIDDAAISQSMVHYANMAYRADKSFEINPNNGSISDKKVKKVWSREYQKGWEISTNL